MFIIMLNRSETIRPLLSIERYINTLLLLLKETFADDTEARAVSARGLLAQIDAEFVYLLHYFTEIIGKINKISQQLQNQEVDLGSVTILISSLREYLADMRSSNLIEHYFTKANKLCEKCDISSTTTRKRTRKPNQRLNDFITSETTSKRLFEGLEQSCMHHIGIFYGILDRLISELDRQFSKSVKYAMALQLFALGNNHSCVKKI